MKIEEVLDGSRSWWIEQGDCGEVLRSMPSESVHAIVTDPPAGISFMGKSWDADKGGAAEWISWLAGVAAECLRVLKPGGHALVWAIPRTSHWTATAFERAGFEIRDVLTHHYGSGFPKALDVSKAIDRMHGHEKRDTILKVTAWISEMRDARGLTNADIDEHFGTAGMAGHWTSQKSQPHIPTAELWPKMLALLGVDVPPEEIREAVDAWLGMKGQPGPNWFAREVTGQHDSPAAAQTWNARYGNGANLVARERRDNAHRDEAREWQGWATSLKPASEHWILCRRPPVGTIAENVLAHGTGALNVDATRVPVEGQSPSAARRETARRTGNVPTQQKETAEANAAGKIANRTSPERYLEPRAGEELGRWPTNLVLTHSAACEASQCADDCPAEEIDRQSGPSISRRGKPRTGKSGEGWGMEATGAEYDDEGAASRFYPRFRQDGCAPDCPVAEMNDQGGELKSGSRAAGEYVRVGYHGDKGGPMPEIEGDEGGAARFYPTFRYVAKPSSSERNIGLDGSERVCLEFGGWGSEVRKVRLRVDTERSRPRVIDVSGAESRSAIAWSTFLFGSDTTGPSLMGSRSITATASGSTTASKTLSFLARLLTSGGTAVASGETGDGGSPAESAESGAPSITITSDAMASPPGAEGAARPTRLRISASGASVSTHPTVKPVELMRWLCRLITPPNGIVLDPFAGSGTTLIAATREGFRVIGIEREAEYLEIARRRVEGDAPLFNFMGG